MIGWASKDRQRLTRVSITENPLSRFPQIGETWRITGIVVLHLEYGPEISAEVALPLLPTGAGIIKWIATNRSIPGVGERTARRLWDAFGERLYDVLRERDPEPLVEHVGPVAAENLASAFALLSDEVAVLQAFDRYGISPRAAMAACALWGADAVRKLQEDPYSINVVEPWIDVDRRALKLGLAPDDGRRLRAAVAEACARRYSGRGDEAGGSLASTRREIEHGVVRLFGTGRREMATTAIDAALADGDLIQVNGLFQSRGCHMMERALERFVADRLAKKRVSADAAIVDAAIASVQHETGHDLEPEQCEAVRMVPSCGFAVIDGGAGTGKSTVTRALLRVAQALGRPYIQMALSGRAAKRLKETTGHEAMTIHRFVRSVVNGRLRFASGLAVIDEASMIGTPDLWQVLSWLPLDVDLVMIGDQGQLPPISPGRPFEAAIAADCVPRVTLRRIHRQRSDSDIPSVAAEIRAGRLPDLPEFDPAEPRRPGVFMARAVEATTAETVITTFASLTGSPPINRNDLRRLHRARVQVLGATKHGVSGVDAISDAIESSWMAGMEPIKDWGLAVGSKILWTKNDYGRRVSTLEPSDHTVDIMNGSLGIIQRPTRDGAMVLFDDAEQTVAEIYRSDLRLVRRGWAITVHKAQGSAFETIVLPVVRSRLMDRLLIYTALTRAKATAVIVGDEELLRQSLERLPKSWSCLQTLHF